MPTVCTSLNMSKGLSGGRAGKGYACVVRYHVQGVETGPGPGSIYGMVPCPGG